MSTSTIHATVELYWDPETGEQQVLYHFPDDDTSLGSDIHSQWSLRAVGGPDEGMIGHSTLGHLKLYRSAIDGNATYLSEEMVRAPIGKIGSVTLYPGSALVAITTGTMDVSQEALYHLDAREQLELVAVPENGDLKNFDPETLLALAAPIRAVKMLPIPLVYPPYGDNGNMFSYRTSPASLATIERVRVSGNRSLLIGQRLTNLTSSIHVGGVTELLLSYVQAYDDLLAS